MPSIEVVLTMSRITKDHFSFNCPMNWDEMTPSDNGRFCSKCSKEIFNLTDCSLDEVHALQRKHGKICGMLKATALAASLSMVACEEGEDSEDIQWVGLIEAPEDYPSTDQQPGEDQQPAPETESEENR